MKTDLIKTIKDWHIKICIAILILPSLFMFILGLTFEDSMQFIPWWLALLYGWSGLAVAFKLGDLLYKDKKN